MIRPGTSVNRNSNISRLGNIKMTNKNVEQKIP